MINPFQDAAKRVGKTEEHDEIQQIADDVTNLGLTDPDPYAPEPGKNPYDTVAKEFGEERNKAAISALSHQLRQSQDNPPDRAGEVVRIADIMGFEPGYVDRNLDKSRALYQVKLSEEALTKAPVTQRLMRDPAVPYVNDDWESMGTLERVLSSVTSGYDKGDAMVDLGRLQWHAMWNGQWEGYDEQIAPLRERMGQETEFDLGFVAGIPGAGAEMLPMFTSIAEKSMPYSLSAGTGGATGGFLAAGPPGMLAGGLTGVAGGFWIGTGVESGKLEAALAYDEYIQVKDVDGNLLDPQAAKIAALLVGTVNGGLEVFGLKKLFQVLPGAKDVMEKITRESLRHALRNPSVQKALIKFGANVGVAGVAEGGVEAMQELTTILGEALAGDIAGQELDPINWSDATTQVQHAFKRGTQGAIAMGAPGSLVSAGMGVRDARAAAQRKAFFEALGEGAAASKLRERVPGKFKEFLDSVLKQHGSIDTVFVEPVVLEKFFQDSDLTNEQIETLMPGAWEQLQESQTTGADVGIPLAEFVEHVAPSKLLNNMIQDLKFSPEDKTPRQIQEARQEADDQWQEWRELAQREADKPGGAQTVYNNIYRQLVDDVGYSPRQATTMATMMERAFNAFGDRLPMTGDEFFKSLNLSVQAEDLTLMADEPSQIPTQFDSILNALRRGDTPKQRDLKGPTLAEYLIEKGGIRDDTGDLAARDLDKATSELGGRKLAKENGMSLEEAYEHAYQDGYLEEGLIGEQAILEAIDNEMAGQPIFSELFTDPSKTELGLQFEQFEDMLAEAGLYSDDLQGMSNEEVRKALGVETYYQTQQDLFDDVPDDVMPTLGQLRQSTTVVHEATRQVNVGFDKIENMEQAITAVDYIAKKAQEYLTALVVDENGKPINIFLHSIGGKASASADDGILAGAALRTPGAAEVYLIHNHPSGRPELSDADVGVYERVENLLDGTGVSLKGMAATTPGGAFNTTTPSGLKEGRAAERVKDNKVPILERELVFNPTPETEDLVKPKPGKLSPYAITSPLNAKFVSGEVSQGESGIMLLDAGNTPVGFLPVDFALYGDGIRGQDLQRKALEAFESTNASAAILTIAEDLTPEIMKVVNNTGRLINNAGVKVLDAINLEKDGNTSLVEQNKFIISTEKFYQRDVNDTREGKAPKGYIEMDDIRSFFRITITGKANLSTFLHESGHFFLEAMQKAEAIEGAEPGIARDLKIVRDWMGLKAGEPIERKHHEQFARGFEAYLMEGHAPSDALMDVFATFKSWLLRIYRTVRSLQVELSPDIRGVMDRLLATDQEIMAQSESYVPVFENAEDAGMSQAEYQSYIEHHESAIQAATQQVEREVVKDITREKESQYRHRKKQLTEEITGEVNREPVYAVQRFIRSRTASTDYDVPEYMAGKRINRDAIFSLFPDSRIFNELAGLYAREGGLHPDEFASVFGFSTGYEMLQQIVAQPKRADVIEQRVQQRLDEEFGDILKDGKLEEKVQRALHNNEVGNYLLAEAKAIGKKVGVNVQDSQVDMARRAAQEKVRNMPLHQLQPSKYRQAEIKFGKLAREAVATKDFKAASQYTLQRLINHYMYREVAVVRDDFERTRKHLLRYNKKSVRQVIGKASSTKNDPGSRDYLQAIDTLLDGIDLRKTPFLAVNKRLNLRAWLGEKAQQGELEHIDPVLMDEANLKSYQEMTLQEFEALRDAVDQIGHAAQFKHQLLVNKEKRDLRNTADALIDLMEVNAPGAKKQPSFKKNFWHNARDKMEDFLSALTKVEFITRWIDGSVAGFAHEMMFQPFVDAQNAKFDKLKIINDELQSHFDAMDAGSKRRLNDDVLFMGRPIKRRDVYAVALNMGNEGNLTKLLKGYKWQQADVLHEIQELLTVQDFETIQKIWDTVESLWPDIVDVYKRNLGIVPPKVEARELHLTKLGITLKGGYYPVVYDRELDFKTDIHGESDQLFENNFMRPGVSKGFTEGRTEYVAPIELSLDVLPNHINEVVHYLTHYEAVVNTDKLLRDEDFRKAFTESFGRHHYKRLRPWIQAIANSGTEKGELTFVDSFSRHMRIGMSVTAMGLNLGTAIIQTLGILTTVDAIGVKDTLRGINKLLLGGKAAWDFAHNESGEMRHLMRQMDREIATVVNDAMGVNETMGAKGWNKVKENSFIFIGIMQRFVNMATWHGAYDKAQREGKPHLEATRFADATVRQTQSGAGMKDLVAIQRGGEFGKLMTAFYTFFSVMFNLQRDALRQLAGTPNSASHSQRVAVFAYRSLWLLFLPAIVDRIMRGQLPDDDEDLMAWMAKESIGYASLGVPGLRDFVGGLTSDFDANPAPALQLFEKSVKSATLLADLTGDEKDLDDLKMYESKRLLEIIGWATHMPTKAVGKWLEWVAVEDQEAPVRNLIYGVPYDERD